MIQYVSLEGNNISDYINQQLTEFHSVYLVVESDYIKIYDKTYSDSKYLRCDYGDLKDFLIDYEMGNFWISEWFDDTVLGVPDDNTTIVARYCQDPDRQ